MISCHRYSQNIYKGRLLLIYNALAVVACSLPNPHIPLKSMHAFTRITPSTLLGPWFCIAVLKAQSVTKPAPSFTRLDPSRPEIAILLDAMLRAREVVAARSWSTSQEPTSENWWADVLADPRARRCRISRGLHSHSGGGMRKSVLHSC
jgi:hypothetical protein